MLIQAKNVSKIYATKSNTYQALKDVDFSVEKAESVAILGKSGSGKSTLMHLLAGLDTPTSGEIIYDGTSLQQTTANKLAELRNRNFGFVFQQFFLQSQLSVLENVALPLRIQGIRKQAQGARSTKLIHDVGLSDKIRSKAVDLSGGQKQRTALARALVTNPSIIFADEPTGNLDEETGNQIMQLLFQLQKENGTTLVIVTHDQDIASRCDHVVYIKDGTLHIQL